VFGLIFEHARELETEKDARKRKKTVRRNGRGGNGVVSGSGCPLRPSSVRQSACHC